MELFERRRYYFCRYCGSFHFLDNPDADGIQVLETAAQALKCPRCAGTLASALLDEHPVRLCTACRGVAMPRRSFAVVVQMRRMWATGQPLTPSPLNPAELERAMVCPSCSARMTAHPYYGPGNVIIDTCQPCDLVWLDFGELKQITDAPGSDRGIRKPPQRPSSETVLPAERAALAASPDGFDFLLDLLS
jgi:Zn-finger nucleic acid-binding protein